MSALGSGLQLGLGLKGESTRNRLTRRESDCDQRVTRKRSESVSKVSRSFYNCTSGYEAILEISGSQCCEEVSMLYYVSLGAHLNFNRNFLGYEAVYKIITEDSI